MTYCSFDDPSSQSVDFLLSSLLKQVLQISLRPLSKEINDLYILLKKQDSRPQINEICDITSLELRQFERTFILIDAVDELNHDIDREDLLLSLRDLKEVTGCLVMSGQLKSTSRILGPCRNDLHCAKCNELAMDVC